MARPNRFSPQVRERAVRMVVEYEAAHESQWAAITSIAEKIGCTAETLRGWVRQTERDAGRRPGLTTEERQRLTQLERENFELRRANEILKKAAAFFAQAELDRRFHMIGLGDAARGTAGATGQNACVCPAARRPEPEQVRDSARPFETSHALTAGSLDAQRGAWQAQVAYSASVEPSR